MSVLSSVAHSVALARRAGVARERSPTARVARCRPFTVAAAEGPGGDWGGPAEAVRAVAVPGTLQAQPGPHRGGGEEALLLPPEKL